MADLNYTMREYTLEDLPRVAELQRQLLGDDVEHNLAYLRWKYHDNPQADRPWAIVAQHERDGIVGFRGFVPSLWQDSRSGAEVPMLALADTCVDTDHRRRGLFTAMTRASLEYFGDAGYRAIINLSTSAAPAPGYIKMGWQIFGHHGYLVRLTLRGVVARVLPLPVATMRTCTGRRGDLVCTVEDRPGPAAMAAVVAQASPAPGRLVLKRDEEFYNWRFGNVRERYTFALAHRGEEPVAFVVVREDGAAGSGAIIDYAETEAGGIESLVDLLLGSAGFVGLSVWNAGPDGADERLWRSCGFRSLEGLKKLVRRTMPPLPLLVRPLAGEPVAEDWCPAGLDLRRPGSWHIMEICSDGS